MTTRVRPQRAAAPPQLESASATLKTYGSPKRYPDRVLLTDVERLLLEEHLTNADDRSPDVLHASELSHLDFCPRSAFLRIRAARNDKVYLPEPNHFQLENIFEEGHAYHEKWQNRWRRMGRLWGRWQCMACGYRWNGWTPTKVCGRCRSRPAAARYVEVHLQSEEHLIKGHADGLVAVSDEPDAECVLVEVKSVGEGTIRKELPHLFGQYSFDYTDDGKTYKAIDHRRIWNDVTKPFPSHYRQGYEYLWLASLNPDIPMCKRIVFIYEYKPTSAVKEFVVVRDDDAIVEIKETALDIVYALEQDRAPRCISTDGPCSACKPFLA